MSPDTYQTILAQHHLRETGYYPEKIDGRDSVDGAWGPISTTSCKRWFTDLDKSKITNPFVGILRALAAQFELANAGLYGGRLDGLWGPLSKKASAEALTMDLGLATPSRPPIVQDTRHQSLPYDVAKQHLGQKEIPGKANNPLILRWLRALASWVTSEETAWCSAFVDYCAR